MSAARHRVLVVEDDFLIAALIEDMLVDLGHELAGSAQSLDSGLALASIEPFDLALLDLQIGSIKTYPVADALAARGIPFAFVTGHGARAVDAAYAAVPVLQKPFRVDDLAATIDRLMSSRPVEAQRGNEGGRRSC